MLHKGQSLFSHQTEVEKAKKSQMPQPEVRVFEVILVMTVIFPTLLVGYVDLVYSQGNFGGYVGCDLISRDVMPCHLLVCLVLTDTCVLVLGLCSRTRIFVLSPCI